MKLLIADDDFGDRKIVRRALLSGGVRCEIIEAESVPEALSRLDEGGVDCAILDNRMPGANGLESIALFRRRSPFLPIVMVTGHGDEMLATEAMKRGAADYIPKSRIEPDILKSAIDNAIEKESLRRKVAAQREELESFARILAHDLMEPIRSTSLAASLIEEAVAADRPEEVARHCQTITRLSKTMKALIYDLRAYTRADGAIEFDDIESDAALDSAIETLRAAVDSSGASITRGALPRVHGNAAQLSQLFQNLISNSLKYCDESRPVIHVEAEPQGRRWTFSVADNGIGVPAAYRDTIFDRFERLHGSSRYEGSGLGLATCRKIVERHGGAIWCEAGAPKGAVFRFTINTAQGRTDA